MAEDQLRTIIDGVRARLQAELESHLSTLAESHEQALENARRRAAVEAEQQWISKLDEARSEFDTRLQAEVKAAREHVEKTLADESTRWRAEAEQAAAQAATQAGRELDEAVNAERARAHADLERAQAERERAHADLERAHADLARAHADRERAHTDRERLQADLERSSSELARAQADFGRVESDLGRALTDLEEAQAEFARAQADHARAQAELDAARSEADVLRAGAARDLSDLRASFDAERAAIAGATPQVQHVVAPSARETADLLDAVRAIDESTTLSAALAAVVRGAARESARVALFLVNGSTLEEWPVEGVAPVDSGPIRSDGREAGFLAHVLATGEAQSTDGTNGSVAPTFARLSPGQIAIAVPFVLDGRPVAVLYADEGADGQAPASWRETVQILGRHGAAYIAYLTSIRTAQALKLMAAGGVTAGATTDDEAQGARRYARLLVSEIKLYNEGAVRTGRERRDLRQRLKPEIERARKLYDERIASSIGGRDHYFEQELVQTLADGDQSLLG